MIDATNLWYVRDRFDEGRGRWVVRAFRGPRYPDAVIVADEAPELDGAEPAWMVTGDAARRTVVAISERILPSPPAVWFVELRDRPGRPDEAQLVAFATDHLAAGTVIDGFAFAALPVENREQVGAVKWRPSSGVVVEVFVQPGNRRQRLATLLLGAADAIHQSHGWPGAIRSDGRRTDLGDQLVVGVAHPKRVAPWTERADPMDHPVIEATTGAAADTEPAAAPVPAPEPAARGRWLRRRPR
jgi:GNAT superfamily N-acetyltransferase